MDSYIHHHSVSEHILDTPTLFYIERKRKEKHNLCFKITSWQSSKSWIERRGRAKASTQHHAESGAGKWSAGWVAAAHKRTSHCQRWVVELFHQQHRPVHLFYVTIFCGPYLTDWRISCGQSLFRSQTLNRPVHSNAANRSWFNIAFVRRPDVCKDWPVVSSISLNLPYFTSFQCVHIRAVVAHLAGSFSKALSRVEFISFRCDHSMVIPSTASSIF